MEIENLVQELYETILGANNIFVLTGAGISTSSGIPDFRGPGGFYETQSTSVFDIEVFYKNPNVFYKAIAPLASKILHAEPNPAHYLITELEKVGKLSLVATQNIDGLHQKAGTKNVAELHGTLETAHCIKCGRQFAKQDYINEAKFGNVPKCSSCGGTVKPDIVFFGEALPYDALFRSQRAASNSDLCIVFGSSLVIQPAASLPLYTVENGGKLIIIGFGETPLDKIAFRKYSVPIEKLSKEILKLMKSRSLG